MAEGIGTLSLEEVESKYLVSKDLGFLIDCSKVKLQKCWRDFERLAVDLTYHVENKTIRVEIERLNGDHAIPQNKLEQLCLHKILTFLTSGYVWQDGEKDVPKKLPTCLALPLTRVSDALGMKPILSYPSMILANWQLKDPKGPFDFENLQAMYQTPGGDGAEWFILTHVIIEQRFAPAIKAVIDAVKYSSEGHKDSVALIKALQVIPRVMTDMIETFKRIKDRVEPEHFYDHLRIFYSGWGGGNKPLPNGLIYEGVSPDPKPMKGGSAAQSTTLQVLDAALGITHSGDEKAFLDEVRYYMLEEHRNFCDYLWKHSNIRNYVSGCGNDDVQMAYNACIDAIKSFRGHHKDKVVEYIKTPSTRAHRNRNVDGIRERGTGSTPYLDFLKKVNTNTNDSKLKT